MNELVGKVAVVTGAAGGIGLGLARRFAHEGMRVVMADVDAIDLTAAVRELDDAGHTVVGVPTDVTRPGEVAALADAAYDRFGAVDVLCNNAGVVGPVGDPLWTVPPHDWERVFSVDVLGIVHGLAAFVPRMLAGGREGHIVNTASMQSFTTSSIVPCYSAAKHAVLAVSETLRHQLHERGALLKVTVLCPGPVRTQIMAREQSRGDGSPVPVDDLARRGVGGDVVRLEPEDVASVVVDAIRTERFYAFTHPDSRRRIEARYESLLGNLDP